jgi:hypothetical protein
VASLPFKGEYQPAVPEANDIRYMGITSTFFFRFNCTGRLSKMVCFKIWISLVFVKVFKVTTLISRAGAGLLK